MNNKQVALLAASRITASINVSYTDAELRTQELAEQFLAWLDTPAQDEKPSFVESAKKRLHLTSDAETKHLAQ